MLPSAWIYILTNINHFVLYTGVTTNLRSRLYEHSTGHSRKSFTFRYSVSKLVYYEGLETIKEAIRREKYIKGKSRAWKEGLINSKNPEWRDLKDDLQSRSISSEIKNTVMLSCGLSNEGSLRKSLKGVRSFQLPRIEASLSAWPN